MHATYARVDRAGLKSELHPTKMTTLTCCAHLFYSGTIDALHSDRMNLQDDYIRPTQKQDGESKESVNQKRKLPQRCRDIKNDNAGCLTGEEIENPPC